MSLKSEKVAAVKQYIAALVHQNDTTETIACIQDIFQRDAVDGKLYKYCCVNEFTIINILHNTLHCSKPEVFNDPFDANMGWQLPGLPRMSTRQQQNIFSVFDMAKQVIHKTITLDNVPSIHKTLVQKLITETEFPSLLTKCEAQSHCTEEDVVKLLESFVCIMPEHAVSKAYQKTPDVILRILHQKIANIATKNTATINSMSQLAAEWNPQWDVDNIDGFCLISRDLQFPDESLNIVHQFSNQMQAVLSQIRNHTLIGCVTTTHKNRLMWAHYGHHHQGICIEYDFSNFNFNAPIFPLPVCYATKRPSLPKDPNKLKNPQKLAELAYQGYLQKDADWQYENEWRIFMNAESDGNFKMPPISCIYLGACISDVHKEIICNLAQQQGITVKQMKMDREIYELRAHAV